MFINRDWNRTEHDDFQLNVLPRLGETTEALPIYHDINGNNTLVGWKIIVRFL